MRENWQVRPPSRRSFFHGFLARKPRGLPFLLPSHLARLPVHPHMIFSGFVQKLRNYCNVICDSLMGSFIDGVRHEQWAFYSIASLSGPPSTDRASKRPGLSFANWPKKGWGIWRSSSHTKTGSRNFCSPANLRRMGDSPARPPSSIVVLPD